MFEWAYLYTSMVTNLNVVYEVSFCNNDTSTLVPADQWKLGGQRPVSVHGMKISVAHSRELDVDQDLIWAWLLHGYLLVLDWSPCLLDDLRPLLLWDFLRHVDTGVLCCQR